MKVPALIMAGGKGKRMGLPVEKPLLPFLGKPLIDWVAKAVESTAKAGAGRYCEPTPKATTTI
jgi:GTP:adenosylcobinamide-phosphate guanylyltransferase